VKFWIEASRSLIGAAVIALANAVLIFIDWAVLVLFVLGKLVGISPS
jgi:hypothetical protein